MNIKNILYIFCILPFLWGCNNEDDIDEMLGLSRDAFRKRAKEFIEIIKDPIKSQEIGIRSTYGNTITIPANAQINDEYVIYIEGTGGLSLRKVSW